MRRNGGGDMAEPSTSESKASKRHTFLQILGPGLITGASDDDPSGIATYSQVGAQFGYDLSGIMLLSYPLMCAIQEISARIGRVTGQGIAANLRRHFSPTVVQGAVLLLFIANTINLGADLGAMGDVLKELVHSRLAFPFVLAFGLVCVSLEIFLSYRRYVAILKWITLSLLAYVAAALVIDIPWREVALRTVIPSFGFDTKAVTAMVAVMGTTISPYLFFWQSSQEAEEERENPEAKPLKQAPQQATAELQRIRIDTYIGMFASNAVGWFIIVTAAATIHARGGHDVATAAQAAQALQPIAGEFAAALFAAGIIGTGMLAVPVLAGSAAYALAETLRWPAGLARKPRQAKAFYGTVGGATLLGIAFNLFQFDPMKALFWTAVLNGIVAVPMMALTMIMAQNRTVMGRFTLPRPLAMMGWLATAIMTLVVIALFVTWGD
jgi:NRAMP (natural resistance-associated macrophage protein)-like metal ion transporter